MVLSQSSLPLKLIVVRLMKPKTDNLGTACWPLVNLLVNLLVDLAQLDISQAQGPLVAPPALVQVKRYAAEFQTRGSGVSALQWEIIHSKCEKRDTLQLWGSPDCLDYLCAWMLICLLLIFASHLEGQWFNSDKFVFILFSGLLTIELP